MSDILREDIFQFTVSGKAETAAEALQKAFGSLRKQAYGSVPGPIVYMEPVAMQILDRKETKTREAFLFVFFPRERREVTVEVVVGVKVRYAEI